MILSSGFENFDSYQFYCSENTFSNIEAKLWAVFKWISNPIALYDGCYSHDLDVSKNSVNIRKLNDEVKTNLHFTLLMMNEPNLNVEFWQSIPSSVKILMYVRFETEAECHL